MITAIAYFLVRDDITVTAAYATQVAFKHCAPFTKCITKICEAIIDDTSDLDLVIPMYNLIEFSSNQLETTGSFILFILKIKQHNVNADIANTNNFESLKYNAKLLHNVVADGANGILKKCNDCCTIKILK